MRSGRTIVMSTDSPPAGRRQPRVHRSSRDEVRARARSARRFHGAPGGPTHEDDGGGEGPIWPPPGEPSYSERRVEWPYWLVLIMPWLTLGAAWLLDHLQVCFMCLPANMPVGAP